MADEKSAETPQRKMREHRRLRKAGSELRGKLLACRVTESKSMEQPIMLKTWRSRGT